MATAKIVKVDGNNVEVQIKDTRLSFFNGFEPQEGKDDDGNITRYNYNGSLLIPKVDEDCVKVIKDAMSQAKKLCWGDNPPRLSGDKLCLRDGEPEDEEGNRKGLYDGYDGMFYVSANKPVKVSDYEQIKAGKKKRPLSIVGPRKGPDGKFKQLQEGDEFAPYSGCFSNVVIRIYGYKGDPAKNRPARLNASFEAVQFKRHGESFGSRGVDANDAFDDEEGEDGFDDGAAGAAATGGDDEFAIG